MIEKRGDTPGSIREDDRAEHAAGCNTAEGAGEGGPMDGLEGVGPFSGGRFKVDMGAYFSQHDIVYREPVEIWENGLCVGNGDLVANAFFPQNGFAWGLTKADVWDNRFERDEESRLAPHSEIAAIPREKWLELGTESYKGEGTSFTKNREYPFFYCPPGPKPCGVLRIGSPEIGLDGLLSFTGRLSLYHGELRARHETDRCSGRIDSFVDAGGNLLTIHCRFSLKEESAIRISLIRRPIRTLGSPDCGSDGELFWVDYTFPDGFRYVLAAAVTGKEVDVDVPVVLEPPDDGGVSAVHRGRGLVEFVVLCTVVTSKESADPLEAAKRNLRQAFTPWRGHAKRQALHRKWWRGFWAKSFINISDGFLENLWYKQIYDLACCSRGAQPPALFAPGCMDDFQRWHGCYTGNINVQMVTWPIFASNHIELGAPYFKVFSEGLAKIKRETKILYGIEGAKYPSMTNGDCEELGWVPWARYWQCVSAWYAEAYWWHYLYTKDEEFLRNVGYPVLRETARFYTEYMQRDEEGRYYIYPSSSPEQVESLMAKNPVLDLALIKELFQAAVEASTVLGRNEADRRKWKERLENLSDYPTDGNVFLDCEGAEPDMLLAHPTLVAPVYPAGDIGVDSPPERYEMARRSLEGLFARSLRKVSNFPFDLPTWNDDMSWPWILCGAARLGLGEMTRAYMYDIAILQYLKNNGGFTYQVVMEEDDREVKPAIFNSGCGFAAALCEMLLQSYDRCIRLFPAVPADWECRIADMRAANAFLVTSEYKDGEVSYALIKSRAGSSCRIANPWGDRAVRIRDGEDLRIVAEGAENTLEFATQKDHAYILDREEKPFEGFPRIVLRGERREQPRVSRLPRYLCRSDDPWSVYLGRPATYDWPIP